MADKKIFEQPENTNPSLTDNIAIGNATEPSRTMMFSTLVSWLENHLGFFRTANNLAEGNASSIRTNISVYSKSEVDSKDASKADRSNVLERDNTDAYTPSLSYHPATLKTVNDGGIRTLLTDCTFSSTVIDEPASSVKAIRIGAYIFVSGYIKLDSDPTSSPIAFVLPTGVGVPAIDIYISGHDGSRANSQNTVMKASANSRSVIFLPHEWSTQLMYFTGIIPVKL